MNKLPGYMLILLFLITSKPVLAFCGFYVAKADTKLFNKASKVIMVRDKNRTVITMANDFKGDPKEFAIVIPVPTVLQREQVHVTNRAIIDHLDAYTSPRLVEYHDGNPCQLRLEEKMAMSDVRPSSAMKQKKQDRAKSLGITIAAEYTVGEYDILILSALQSNGLEIWLKENGYKIPAGASRVLGSYIKQGMKFFVARVNLKEQAKSGFTFLRPLQVAFESPKFMLPIRLGTLNANGPQDMYVFALTRTGRVESINYRTVSVPSNVELPVYVKETFSDFYRDMFQQQVAKENNRAVFLEYAWDMNWCDPCAADPLSNRELRELGVYWLADKSDTGAKKRIWGGRQMAKNTFVTRMHVRYTADTFPEDLMFQETGNRSNFQGRYIIRHPWKGKADCEHSKQYYQSLVARQEREARTLASLTGWKFHEIMDRVNKQGGDIPVIIQHEPWWKKIWD